MKNKIMLSIFLLLHSFNVSFGTSENLFFAIPILFASGIVGIKEYFCYKTAQKCMTAPDEWKWSSMSVSYHHYYHCNDLLHDLDKLQVKVTEVLEKYNHYTYGNPEIQKTDEGYVFFQRLSSGCVQLNVYEKENHAMLHCQIHPYLARKIGRTEDSILTAIMEDLQKELGASTTE